MSAGDFNKPNGESAKNNILEEIRDNLTALATMSGAAGNPPDTYIKYNASTKKLQIYNSSSATWSDLDLIAPKANSANGTFAKTDLPATTVYTDVAQTFTEPQSIDLPYAKLLFKNGATSGGMIGQITDHVFSIRCNQSDWDTQKDTSKSSWKAELSSVADSFSIWRCAAGGGSTWTRLFKIDSSGKMTDGVVPLARMASLYDNSSVTLTAGASSNRALGTSTGHTFCTWSVYCLQVDVLYDTANSSTKGAAYMWRQQSGTFFTDYLTILAASSGSSATFYFKVYKFTES